MFDLKNELIKIKIIINNILKLYGHKIAPLYSFSTKLNQ